MIMSSSAKTHSMEAHLARAVNLGGVVLSDKAVPLADSLISSLEAAGFNLERGWGALLWALGWTAIHRVYHLFPCWDVPAQESNHKHTRATLLYKGHVVFVVG